MQGAQQSGHLLLVTRDRARNFFLLWNCEQYPVIDPVFLCVKQDTAQIHFRDRVINAGRSL
jgi:hypothetical protein